MAFVFVDTGAVFAIFDRSDAHHNEAKRRVSGLRRGRVHPLLTNFIVAETHALMLRKLGPHIARRWLLGNAWRVEPVLPADEQRARAIIASHTDKAYSYTDATSFAVMERLGTRRAFAFDRHFEQYGFELI